MKFKQGILGLALLTAIGCRVSAEDPPEIVVDRTVCSHCGMLISETLYAAASRAPGTPGRVFDDIGCLLADVRDGSGSDQRFWFHDAAHGAWIDGTDAVFVKSPDFRTPMGGGLLAYSSPAAAAEAAGRSDGEVLPSLQVLLRRPRGM
jgi:copper chaperone NosL